MKNLYQLSEGKQQSMYLTDQIDLSRIFKLTAGIGIYSSQSGNEQSNHTTLARRVSLEGFWNEKLYTYLNYKNEVYSYSPELLRSNIALNIVSLAANYNLSASFGFYNKALLTHQSDNNQSSNLFSSLYYTFSKNPLVKVGVNNNILHFSQSNDLYFSPDLYHSYEGFAMINNAESGQPFTYGLLVAIGQQRIEQGAPQLMHRIDSHLSLIHI